MAWQPSPEAMKTLMKLNATFRMVNKREGKCVELVDILSGEKFHSATMIPETPETEVLDKACREVKDRTPRKSHVEVIAEKDRELSELRAKLERLENPKRAEEKSDMDIKMPELTKAAVANEIEKRKPGRPKRAFVEASKGVDSDEE